MVSKEHTQRRILNLVELYKRAFPNEYKMACDGIIMQRQLQENEMGTLKGEHSGASAQRILFETPENLYMSFVKELDGDEMLYFKSKEGARWFTKAVPQFAIAKL